jgi:hypothetical protein
VGDGIGSSSSVAEVSAHQPPNRFLSMQLLASTCRVPRTDPWTSTTSRPRIEPSKYQAGLRGSISWLAPGRKRAIATLDPIRARELQSAGPGLSPQFSILIAMRYKLRRGPVPRHLSSSRGLPPKPESSGRCVSRPRDRPTSKDVLARLPTGQHKLTCRQDLRGRN